MFVVTLYDIRVEDNLHEKQKENTILYKRNGHVQFTSFFMAEIINESQKYDSIW